MQYCYNLIGAKVEYGNYFGLCLEQEEPWVNGQIVIYGTSGYQYTVYRCIELMFKCWDTAAYMGGIDGFVAEPTQVIQYAFTSLKINGVEKLTAPFIQNYGAAEYENFIAPTAGFDHYSAAWDSGELNNTEIAVIPLSQIFTDNDIPIGVQMYTSASGVMDYVCMLVPESMSISIEMTKTHNSIVTENVIVYNHVTGETSYEIDTDIDASVDEDTIEGDSIWVTEMKCPNCFEGTYCFSLISCNEDLYPSVNNICTTNSALQSANGKIVTFDTSYAGSYTLQFNGLDACVCESEMPEDINISELEDCPSGDLYTYVLQDCLTGGEIVVTTDTLIEIPDVCGCENEDWDINPETGLCEKYEETEATLTGAQITVQAATPASSYGWGGAVFYESITAKPKPARIKVLPNVHIEDGSNTTIPIIANRNYFWDNTSGVNGRLNTVGVKGSVPNGEWVGFSHCLTYGEAKKINIGLGSDNAVRIKLNGDTIIDLDSPSNQFSFNYWHVFEIDIIQGFNVIEILFKNNGLAMSFGAEIYLASQAQLLPLTTEAGLDPFIIWSTKDMVGEKFLIGNNHGYSCPDGYSVTDCDNSGSPVCTLIERVSQIECPKPVIELAEYPCKCFSVIDTAEGIHQLVTVLREHRDCKICLENLGKCEFSERVVAHSIMVKLPNPPVPDRGFKSCCYSNRVFGKIDSSRSEYNDFNGFYFQRQTPSDTCDFTLIRLSDGNEYSLDDSTYGEFVDFGGYATNTDLTTYIVRWKKVLTVLGEGIYQIKKEISIAGIPFEELSNTFVLSHFTHIDADQTVRLDCVMDGTLVHYGVDFKGTGFTTSLRTGGFFGRREPEYVQDNLVRRNLKATQIQMSQENEYQYQTCLLPECITEELFDFILFGNELLVSDYNGNNHSYKFTRFEIELKSNKGTEYYVTGRPAQVNLTFNERYKNKRKTNC